MGPFSHQGRFPTPFFSSTTNLVSSSSHVTPIPRTEDAASKGNCRLAFEEGYRTGDHSFTRLRQPHVCDPKEKWRFSPSVQFEKVKTVHNGTLFQNGDIAARGQVITTRRFPHFSRYAGRFSTHFGASRIKTLPAISVGRHNLSISHNSFRSNNRPMAIHKAYTTNPQVCKISKHKDVSVFGRLVDHGSSVEEARDHTRQVISLLQHLGWVMNLKKSHLQPSQVIEHLGHVLDTNSMTVKLPGTKLRDLRRSIKQILIHPCQSARKIHSLTMRFKAATMAIFPAAMYTQGLMRFKNNYVRRQQDWDQVRSLPQEWINELKWWNLNLEKWNGRSIMQPAPSSRVYVDASNLGWGAVVQGQVVQGTWTQEEAQHSINWRELKAVHLTLQSFPFGA